MFSTVEFGSRDGDGGSNANEDQGSRRISARPRRKRKFPGPAGILPDLNDRDVANLNRMQNQIAQQVTEIISSQRERPRSRSPSPFSMMSSQAEKNLTILSQGPWEELKRQLNLSGDENCPSRLMSISWIQNYASHLPAGAKVPFFVGVLQEAPELPSGKHQKKTPCVKLGDATGTIEAALDPLFVKMHCRELKPGTALAVTNAGLLHFKRNVILTVTSKNVISLASAPLESHISSLDDDKISSKSNHSASVVTEDGIKIIFFSDFSTEKVMKNYRQLCDPNVIRQQYLRNQKNKQTSHHPLAEKPTVKLFTHIAPASDSCSALFINFEDDDEDDDLFRAFDMEATENSYFSQQEQDSRKQLSPSNQPSQIIDNQANQTIDQESEDEFDRELAAFDDGSCDIIESSQPTQTSQQLCNTATADSNPSSNFNDKISPGTSFNTSSHSNSPGPNHVSVNPSETEIHSSSGDEAVELGPNQPADDDSDFFNEFDRELDEL